MELEDQVCNLELAQKLKKLGVNQKSLWYIAYSKYTKGNIIGWEEYSSYSEYDDISEWSSAFTVAELGEIIRDIESKPVKIEYWEEIKPTLEDMIDSKILTEANARTMMFIWLIEKGMVKV